ncbi:signal recognition particle protein [Blattabacterium cuenoti]|uniref:signal recognition particle protein n=1 Tax=Blattabacterium cuenoti TaxID=1653831 RepID=UPI00163C3BDB|nr:signal recognition particle protein [Blattabacterium cuenoti]
MFESLQEKINKAIHVLKGHSKITEINLASSIKEIGQALIDADVNYQIVKDFIKKIKKKSLGKKVLTSLNPEQIIIKIVYDELVTLMGGKSKVGIHISSNPFIILICGLQGSGKTSFSSKLSFFFKKRGHHPMVVAADIYRPAAIDQLNLLLKKVNIPVFSYESKNVLDIIDRSMNYALEKKRNIIIIDTAGRLGIDEKMMKEIKLIKQHANPNEILFVVDAMTGQDAINSAQSFYKILKYNGIVMTKLDGDTRGGAAITISSVIRKPIKFISNGEKIEDIEIFYPNRIANRILGRGDIVSLVEKVQEQFDEKKAKKIYHKISKNRFNFNDLLNQIKKLKKMGNIKNIISMIPGIQNSNFFQKNNHIFDHHSFKKIESMIYSMTPYERRHPKIVSNIDRKKRIAMGSGVSLFDVNLCLKQFNNISQIMKKIHENSGKEMVKQFFYDMMNKKNEL